MVFMKPNKISHRVGLRVAQPNLHTAKTKTLRPLRLRVEILLLNSCSKYQYTLGITVRPELVEGQAD